MFSTYFIEGRDIFFAQMRRGMFFIVKEELLQELRRRMKMVKFVRGIEAK